VPSESENKFFDQKRRTKREGNMRNDSFCYFFLDPRQLPEKFDDLNELDRLRVFVGAIFYIGKGTGDRPYQHLNDALKLFDGLKNSEQASGEKLQTIISIWKADLGVILFDVFHDLLPIDALICEAAMIDAIGIPYLGNKIRGHYYGLPSEWASTEEKKFGVFLLNSASQIFKHDGEGIRPQDIRTKI